MENFSYPQIGKVNSDRVLRSIIHRLNNMGCTKGNLDRAMVEASLPVHYQLFISVINIAREYKHYTFNLKKNFGYDLFSYPSASAAQGVVNAIQLAMLDDENQYVNYYIHELDFGDKWKPGMVVDPEGNDVRLTCDEALWHLLVDNIYNIVKDLI